eukprot:2846660-Pyramimonas_sp.AAC.1
MVDSGDGSRTGPPRHSPLKVGDVRAHARLRLFEQFPLALPRREAAPAAGGRRLGRLLLLLAVGVSGGSVLVIISGSLLRL